MSQEKEEYDSFVDQDSSEDEEFLDTQIVTEPSDFNDASTSLREDKVEKVFLLLSADAIRGEGHLKREDIERTFFRKELTFAECMAIEEKLEANGYQIMGADYTQEGDQKSNYLTEAEEKMLGRQIQKFIKLPEDTSALNSGYVERIKKDAVKAKEKFLKTNIFFVQQLARRMGHYQNFSLDDLIQEGYIGLLHATDRYDPERGFRFKTYAGWWIQQKMHRAVADGNRTIRLPVHTQEKLSQIKRAKSKLTQLNGETPNLEKLALALGMDAEKLMKFLWHVQSSECTEIDMVIGDDTPLISLIADEDNSSPFEIVSRTQLKENLLTALGSLAPREEKILRMRFGFDMQNEQTLESIGQQFDLTRERIRQIEAKALRKLRHPERGEILREFLDD